MKSIQKICMTLLVSPFIFSVSHALDLPETINLKFTGPYGVPAKMHFSHDHKTFSIVTEVAIPFKNMRFSSKGLIKENELLPTEFRDYRGGERYAYANYDYGNQTITYGKRDEVKTAKLLPQSKDFYTLAWQMAIDHGVMEGVIQTTNGKKVYTRTPFVKIGTLDQRINRVSYQADHYQNGEGDDRIEVALLPEKHFIPSLIVYYDKGKRYELKLNDIDLEP
ncbi:MAG: hypothetical protein GX667_10955 [Xanthomonadaceae bacterium]|nr:hypothetical protein [Xanthomonadaceae bacterium]